MLAVKIPSTDFTFWIFLFFLDTLFLMSGPNAIHKVGKVVICHWVSDTLFRFGYLRPLVKPTVNHVNVNSQFLWSGYSWPAVQKPVSMQTVSTSSIMRCVLSWYHRVKWPRYLLFQTCQHVIHNLCMMLNEILSKNIWVFNPCWLKWSHHIQNVRFFSMELNLDLFNLSSVPSLIVFVLLQHYSGFSPSFMMYCNAYH